MEACQMREVLRQQYGGSAKWQRRVDSMSDRQVVAVYYSMVREGRLK